MCYSSALLTIPIGHLVKTLAKLSIGPVIQSLCVLTKTLITAKVSDTMEDGMETH